MQNQGMRVLGTFNGFELAVQAILGQQITVKAATTLARRLVCVFGEEIDTPFEGINRLSPTAELVASLPIEALTRFGIISSRAHSIIILTKEVMSGRLVLEDGYDIGIKIRQLMSLPGIGAWTAHYIARQALCWNDAFPKENIALRKIFGGITAKQAKVVSQIWSPWRSYATMHIWNSLNIAKHE